MKELTCPNCHTTFQVDDNVYATILAQVRGEEFEKEIGRRAGEIKQQYEAREATVRMEVEKSYGRQLADKNQQLAESHTEITRLKGEMESYEARKQSEMMKLENDRDRKLFEAMAAKDKEIAELKSQLNNIKTAHELNLTNERNMAKDRLHNKEQEITELTSRLESQKLAAEKQELELKEQHKILIKAKDEEIVRLKDLRSKLSTKMIGETLEQHCQNTFNLARSMGGFAGAYFEKDNDISDGTKGDFIFRDYIDGQECISIMFEMKNEDDRTATKHRNEDFFAKLHKDRCGKGCEYAVLVSTLEADNDLYNEGIVDVSYRFPKMYVIRPQFFMPVISLLTQSSRRSAQTVINLRQELSVARSQSIDVTKFEERRDKFTAEFMKFVRAHQEKHDDAIAAIDKAIDDARKQIDRLEKIKKLFDTSNRKLIRAGEVMENDFTIKKLTHGNPTMRAKFQEARSQAVPDPENLLHQQGVP